jgi:Zn-dependent peptidase ImmA (M78 family)/transcriptional regulator with XRE-family HTH domain
MPRSIPALVKPPLLAWARDRAGLAIDDVATKVDEDPDRIRRWEKGEEQPTLAQVRKLGDIYKRPLAVFFLPEPPKDFDPQREFRRLVGVNPKKESFEMRLSLRMALFRREAARSMYERLKEPLPVTQASARASDDPEIVGAEIRKLLGISWDTQLEWPNGWRAFNSWRAAVEQQGVLVFLASRVELTEMRGISIPRGPLPVILINNKDENNGRIFTLLHEFAHILLANAGHRTSSLADHRSPEDQILERISNSFAAAALMPRQEFLAQLLRNPSAVDGNEEALRRIADSIKVSREAILRRLVTLGRTSTTTYRSKRRQWQQTPWKGNESEGAPPIEARIVANFGRPFVSLVLDAYRQNAASSADVSDYLGIQLKHLDKVARQLASPHSPKVISG